MEDPRTTPSFILGSPWWESSPEFAPKSNQDGRSSQESQLDQTQDISSDSTDQHRQNQFDRSKKEHTHMKRKRKASTPNTSKKVTTGAKFSRRPKHLSFPGHGALIELRSPPSERMQVRARFAQAYYPRSKMPACTALRVLMTSDTDEGQNLALAMAMDAICLAHLGTATGKKDAIWQGARMYSGALSGFRRKLANATTEQTFDDSLLATTQALIFCERFATIGSGDAGAIFHTKGLASLIAARGVDNLTSDFDKLILQDYQHFSIRHGLLTRRPMHRRLDEAWSRKEATATALFPRLNQLAFALPCLLEDCDKVCNEISGEEVKGKAQACRRATAMITRLQRREVLLQGWLKEWYAQGDDMGYTSVPTEEFENFRQMKPEIRAVFPLALKFSTFASATAHFRFYTCLLVIRSAIGTLFNAVMPEDNLVANNAHNVTECADELCRALVFICGQAENGLSGLAAITAHMQVAYQWYKQIGDQKKMEWCWAVAEIVESKGLYPPDLPP